MPLKLGTQVITLKTRHPFVIARGGSSDYRVVWVRLTDADGVEGWGEADPSADYGETADTVLASLGKLEPHLPADPLDLEQAGRRFATPPTSRSGWTQTRAGRGSGRSACSRCCATSVWSSSSSRSRPPTSRGSRRCGAGACCRWWWTRAASSRRTCRGSRGWRTG